MEKEDESSPVLAVAASMDGGEEGVGGSGTLMWLRAEQSSGLLTVRNIVIKKIKLAAVKMVLKKQKGGGILTCAHGRCFSWWWRRGHWRQRDPNVSAGLEIKWPVDSV